MRYCVVGIFLVFLLLPTALVAGDPVWGVGWDAAPTVRLRVGEAWQVGVSYSPSRGEGLFERSYAGDESELHYSQYDEVPIDRDHWSGWAGLNVSRSVVRDGRFDMAVFSGLQFQWLRSDETVDDSDSANWPCARYENEVDSWTFIIGLRPSYALHDRATIDFTFGYSAFWDDGVYTETRWTTSPDSEYRKVVEYSGGKFQTWGGWNGLASLSFIFWL